MQGSDPIQFNDDDNQLPVGEGQELNAADGNESNRPAANANLSENVDATTEDFEFKEDADDFLGLEGEVEVMTDTTNSADSSSEDGMDLADGWLLEVSPEEAAASEASASAETQVEEDTAEAEQLAEYVSSEVESSGLGAISTLEEAEETEEYAHDEGEYSEENSDEFDEDSDEEFDDEFEDEEEVEASSGGSRLFAIVGFCAGIIGTGAFLMMDTGVQDADTSVEVATTANEITNEQSGTQGDAEVASDQTSAIANAAASPNAVTDNEPIENVLEGLLASPSEESEPAVVEPIVFEPIVMDVASTDTSAGIPDLPGMPVVPAVDLEVPVQVQPKSTLVQIAEATQSGDIKEFSEYKTETGSSFIWTGSKVPMDSIAREGRILTPAVGVIRATMNSGELFEGRLYAVGSDRVWIEMGPGRLGLDGTKVEKIERISVEDEAASKEEVGLGQRVRIRTAGGVMYGKVKSRNGDQVTIVTDKGARITLTDPVIESIGRLSGLVLK